MQLKPKLPGAVRGQLALATCTLLSGVLHAAEAGDETWKIDGALLYYTEKDRVSVTEPVASVKKNYGDDRSFTVRAVFDSISGASPNGATPTNTPQTFTSASGNSSYTTPAGEQPRRTFQDTRIALGADWERPLGLQVRNVLTGNISTESDYFSLGFGDTLTRDFNNRLTTLSAGLGVSFDIVNPEGTVPVGMQLLSTVVPVTGESEGSGAQKNTVDVLFGVTQVLTPRAITQLNYTHAHLSGYLTDPYKVISVVDSGGNTVDYRFEKRPDSRDANAVFWKYIYHLPNDVVRMTYRYFWDDWGIRSHTADIRYRLELPRGTYLEPHYRYYRQTAASFYRYSLLNTDPVPAYTSADYRLAEMQGDTVGLKLGVPFGKRSELSLRVERMVQTGNSHPADAIGIQKNYDLYPSLNARSFLLSYSGWF